jgi:hypothetical protein
MATCPSGHQTNQTDFCDVCGLPVTDGISTPPAPQQSATIACPNCGAANVAEALFCESCGYDFTTGSIPAPVEAPRWPSLVPPLASPPVSPRSEPGEPAAPGSIPEAPSASVPDAPEAPAAGQAPPAEVEGEAATPQPVASATPASAPDAGAASVAPLVRPAIEWVAELWIDPDWYTAQGSTDPMPSVGLPDIVGLNKAANLIGRVSHSRGIFPDIDCELDSGCSRRHAMLSTDGTRWWIEDLNSANGTFVGSVGAPLPAMPIPQGRVELADGQRIYVGAWTRIVIRRATSDEQEALGS